ncbi:MAG: gliding motility-associated C-terminal domain-containing protein [Bacteroidota bacterium]
MKNNKFSLQIFLVIFGVIFTNFAHSQCTELTAFGSGTASTVNGTSVTLTTCAFAGEYSTVFGIVAGTTYTATSTSGCVTVHSGTPAGPVVSFGTGSTTFVAPTSGTYYVHYSVNCGGCGDASTCLTGTITTVSGSGGGGGGGGGCNTNTSICTPGVAGPFTFAPGSPNPSSCLNFWNGQAAPNYGYIILYITGAGNLNMLVDANTTGFLDVSVFDITSSLGAPCPSLSIGTELICNYADFSDGCAEFGSTFPGCTSEVPAPAVQVGDVLMILVEDWSNTQTNFTIQLSGTAGSAQTGPPNPAITAVGPFCSTAAAVQLNAVDMGGTWTGPGVSSSGLFNPATAGVGTHTINYSIGSAPCNAASSTTIVVSNANVAGTASSSVTAICGSGNVPLTLTGSTGNIQWQQSPTSGGTYTNIAGATSATYTATGVTTNTCYRAVVSGCGPAVTSNFVCVTVNPLPTINAGADVARCAGQSAPLSASGGSTYTWSPATGLSATNIANPTATPAATQTYTVSGTSVAGCVNTDQVIVTINPLPTINAGADVTRCPGQSAPLSASGGSTYTWSPATGLSATNIANPTATPAATQTYTVSGTSAAGCVNTDQVIVTISPLPTINAGADVAICIGASTPLSASGGSTYTWSPATGLSATNIANPTATPAATQTYTVSGTSAAGCVNTDQVVVTINPLPTINAGADVAICPTQSTPLLATGGATYTWSPATGLSATNIANPTATPAATQTYTVSGTSAAGCVNTDQVIVTINPLPTINAGADVAICPTQSTPLLASGGSTYTWSPATGLSATNIANPTATPAATQTYTVSGTSAAGCVNTDQVIVTISPLPTINAGADVAICIGASTPLSASGGSTYTWSPATGLSATNIANPTATPAATQTYTVSGTSAAGCVNTDQVVVTINPLPTINAGADVAICPTQSTPLLATGGATYTWSPATGLSATNIANPTATPAATQTYTVSGTSAAGCVNTDQVIVTINPLPTINAGADVAICPTQSTPLLASGGSTYTWSPATGLSATNIANPTATPAATQTYTVSGTSAAGCVNTDQVIVTISPLPTINAGADVAICIGASTPLSASGGSTYTWSPATGLSATNIANPTATPAATQTYTVSGTSAAGCVNTDQVIVTINPLPTINAGADVAICPTQSTPLLASGGATYTWSPATGLSATNIANPTATPAATQTYTVTGTSAAGCVNTDQVIVTISASAPINAGADVAICVGASTSLLASGGATYTWSPATGLSATSGSSVTANPSITTTYTVNGTTASGCTGSDQVIVTVNPLPAINAGTDVAICIGASTPLSASGASTYTWSPATGLSATNIANPTATPAATQTYTVSGTSAAGCVNTDQVIVTINPLPTINAGADVSICPTQSTPLLASGGATYTWSPATGLSATNIANPTATPAATQTYTVSGTSAAGCVSTDQVVVTVNAVAAINAGADVAICVGASTSLLASGGATYTWSPATGLSATNIANPTATPATTQTYTVSGTTASGCVGTDQVIVTVNPLPIINAGTDVAICIGASTPLSASGASTYTWSPATGLSATNIANPTATPAATQTYTVSGTSAAGCVNTDQVIVTINPLPTINAGADVSICPTQSTPLLASGGATYTWSPATGLSATNIANPTATPAATQTYTVSGTSAAGCVSTDQVVVTVNAVAAINAGADVAICVGASTSLLASGGATYTWSPATGLSATSGSSVTANPSITTTYTVNGTTASGCTGSDQVIVTVNPLPAINAGTDVAICIGASTPLSASGASTYTWSPATGLSATNIANPTATPAATQTYTVSGTSAAGCVNTDQVIVTINPLPTINAGADVSICPTQSTPLLASGGATYTWSPATGLSATNIANPTATPAATQTYTVSGTSAAGCVSTDQVVVTVNAVAAINAGADVAICVGASTSLLASGGATYTWSPATGLSATNIANPTATPATTQTYTVSGTTASGCVGTDQVIVTVNPLPIINAGTDVAICIGASTPLSASGASTYTWSPATGLSATNIANPTATPVATQTYTVSGTSAAGCVNTDQVIVTINPLPVIDAGLDVAICPTQSTPLLASGGATYTWSPATGLSATNIANPTATPAATQTYTVSGTSAAGCVSTDQVVVTVNAVAAINAGADVAICVGASTSLLASGGATYTWSPATGLSATNIANPTATPATTQTYTVSGTTASGCVGTDQVIVTINPLPVIDAGLDVAICPTQSTPLLATGGATYAWSPATGLSATNIANPTATPAATQTYTVSGTSAAGCVNTDQVIVTINPLPVIDAGLDVAICPTQSTPLLATGGATYAWSPATGLSATNIANPTATPAATQTYTVSGTSAAGCVNTDQVIVTINPLPVIDAGLDVAICPTQSTPLLASGGATYTWSPATGLSATNIANPTATPAATQTYTVSGTSAAGCVSTDQVVVTVNAVAAINAGADVAICVGASTSLLASGGATYTWSPATGLSATNIANPTATPATTQTYTVSGTTASGCVGTDQVIVTVNPLPTINAGTDVAICIGASTPLSASGGSTYTWSPATGLSATNIANPTATPVATQTYTVSGTSAAGCVSSDQVVVTVNPLPTINAGADAAICIGNSTTLGATGGTTYTWSPATGLSATNIANPTANPVVSTTYTVSGTSLGCVASDQVIVTVNGNAPINAGLDVAICQGASSILTASGGMTYTWDNGLGNGNGVSITPLSSTTYNVVGTDVNGCTGTDAITVTINNNPIVNAGVDQAFCPGSQVTLNGNGASTYSWNLGVNDGVAFTVPAVTTTYTVTGTSAQGCIGTDDVVVTINPNPIVSAGIDQTVCLGSQVTLIGGGASTYTWNYGITDGVAFTPAVGTLTYTATGTSIDGCIGTDDVVVTVNPNPTVNAGVDQSICEGTSVTLNGSGASTYTWTNGVLNGVAFSPSVGIINYTVTGTDANGCINTDVATVTVNANPVVSFNADVVQGCTPLVVTLTNTSTGNLSACSWTTSNGMTANSCGPVTMTFNDGGLFDVTLVTTSADGCVGSLTMNNYIYTEDAPIAAFTANPPSVSTIFPEIQFLNNSVGAVDYSWTFGDDSPASQTVNPIHMFPDDEDGSYEVVLVATSSLGCVDTASFVITTIEELIYYIPNTFTPDDDQFNPTFLPIFTSGFDPFDYELLIFNRWGEIVFESHDHEVGWDGTYGVDHSIPCQEGTYTYKVEFKKSINDARKIVTGHVNLLK